MAALVEGAGKKSFLDRPRPVIETPNDVTARIPKTAVRGSDLHILKDGVLTWLPGRLIEA